MAEAWWRQAVVYEVYVRSFADSDGDGVGDLPGITSRLPELAGLGIDAVWLTPFYPSPMVDAGYDVADYCDIDPLFGSLADFDALLAEAHRLGLRVIIDLVPNHTSSEHAWFKAAVAGDEAARARYLFRSEKNNWPSRFDGTVWTKEPHGEQFYLHLFAPEQPDLDWRNPEVPAYFETVLRFWLDRGVDGFRIDVAHGLFKAEGLPDLPPGVRDVVGQTGLPMADQPETLEIYKRWREIVDGYDDRMLVGEVFLYDQERVKAYLRAGLHQSFDFTLMLQPFDADALGSTILGALQQFAPTLPTWVLDNHDLERAASRYGGGVAGRERAVAALSLVLGLPGAPYIYQGDELAALQVDVPPERRQDPIWLRGRVINGIREVGRDGCRTPLPWDGSPGHGFTTGAETWLPFAPDADTVNVAAQQADPESPWRTVQALLARRRELLPTLGETVTRVDASPGVLVLRRDGLTLALNTTDDEQPGPAGPLPPRTCVWLTD